MSSLALSLLGRYIDDRYIMPANGYVATVCFYIITGVYMSMVINEGYEHTEAACGALCGAVRTRVLDLLVGLTAVVLKDHRRESSEEQIASLLQNTRLIEVPQR